MVRRPRDDTADELHSRRMARGTTIDDATMVHQGPAECHRGLMASLTSG